MENKATAFPKTPPCRWKRDKGKRKAKQSGEKKKKGMKGLTLPCCGPCEPKPGGQHVSKTFPCFTLKYCHDMLADIMVATTSPSAKPVIVNQFVVRNLIQNILHSGFKRLQQEIHKQRARPLWMSSFQTKVDKERTQWGQRTVERWECCSLGCRLGGGAWKRPCRGLPLVESAQYPSNHPAPSLSSLPSVNRAGEQEVVWLAAMKTNREEERGVRWKGYPKRAESWRSQRKIMSVG